MKPYQIGSVSVNRVADLEDMPIDIALFPAATPELVARQAPVLGPRFIDPVKLHFLFSFHSFVVRSGGKVILVDACIGNDKHRQYPLWHRRRAGFLANLRGAGVKPEDVDCVMCTHMHADHTGWNTRLENGRWVPTFPNARYLMVETEYRYWLDQRSRAAEPILQGSFDDSVLPVVESGQAEMIGMAHSLAHGVRVVPAAGHTPGNVMLNVEDGSQRLVLGGDVIHHPIQMAHPEWSTRACIDPEQSHRTRRGLLEELAGSAVPLLTAHFQSPTAGYVERHGGAFRFDFQQP